MNNPLVYQTFRLWCTERSLHIIIANVVSLSLQVQADPNRIVVSGQSLAATAVGKTSFFTISNVTGSVEDVEVSVEGELFLLSIGYVVFTECAFYIMNKSCPRTYSYFSWVS